MARNSTIGTKGRRRALIAHPDASGPAGLRVVALVERTQANTLEIAFAVSGLIETIVWPATMPARRADGLWKTTCFEAFVREAGAPSYYEFNFSPSSAWAAYAFDDYRAGMKDEGEVDAIAIRARVRGRRLELSTSIDLARLPRPRAGAPLLVGLSAVIDEASGRKSYWALAHPPGKPDFHHADCFVLEIAGRDQS